MPLQVTAPPKLASNEAWTVESARWLGCPGSAGAWRGAEARPSSARRVAPRWRKVPAGLLICAGCPLCSTQWESLWAGRVGAAPSALAFQ